MFYYPFICSRLSYSSLDWLGIWNKIWLLWSISPTSRLAGLMQIWYLNPAGNDRIPFLIITWLEPVSLACSSWLASSFETCTSITSPSYVKLKSFWWSSCKLISEFCSYTDKSLFYIWFAISQMGRWLIGPSSIPGTSSSCYGSKD